MMTTEEAKKVLQNAIQEDGGLYDLSAYLSYNPGSTTITLDGEFSADELEAITVYIMEHQSD